MGREENRPTKREDVMCGLLFDLGSELSDKQLQRAGDLIQHRGPDETVELKEGPARFIFHRLAIMDLSPRGRQPLQYDQLTLMCNGEIYNEGALREELSEQYTFQSTSDCEVILPLYQRDGAQGMMAHLDGEFALVIYDAEHDRLIAARDPLGVRPL